MNIINFETDHAHKILEGDLNSDDFRPSVEISQFVEGMVVPEMSFTGVTENLVIAAGGIYPIWDGVGEAWFIGSHYLKDNPLGAVRALKRHLHRIMIDHKFHRIQAVTLKSFQNANRWMQFLEMKEEGMMEKFCPAGRDFIRWARVV